MKQKIKIFSSGSGSGLSYKVNKWLEENEDIIRIKDIQFTRATDSNKVEFCAMFYYSEHQSVGKINTLMFDEPLSYIQGLKIEKRGEKK